MSQDTVFANEQPPGMQDILRADAKIWQLLAEACVAGVQTFNGVKPLEGKLDEILKKYEVQALLSVRPRGTTRPADSTSTKGAGRNTRAKTSASPETKPAKHIEN